MIRRELHVSRRSRDRYRFDQELFAFDGKAIFADFHAARTFAQAMNEGRDLTRFPERAVPAGHINAMGLLDELLHLLAANYRERHNPGMDRRAMAFLRGRLGDVSLERALHRFSDEFPPSKVYRGEIPLDEHLAEEGASEGALEELLFLWLANKNPALARYRELFHDEPLAKGSSYRELIEALHEFFADEPPFGPEGESLIEVLRSPARLHPHSLSEQLEYLRQRFSHLLGEDLYRLLGGLDLIAEEERIRIGVGGPGPAQIPDFHAQLEAFADEGDLEYERFSPDREWMPRLVLMAKNVYVWMDQLQKAYGRAIERLDEIPDDEIDRLAKDGFTGLWLIGIWERSPASRRIKHLCGNPDAAASAYSLDDYVVAGRLGGDEAFERLKQRAWQRGVRMSTDMVPNHMGIDSRWLVEDPDRFLSVSRCPYPQYSFHGENLSHDDRVEIRLEDHYYDRSDAAVVFELRDRATGERRYVYHGNDGTSMPWNDTAQLDFLNPETREAVIQTILAVARRSPVIRFDAAMVLARKSIHRLWYPEPGSGEGIPSRAEYGLRRADFDHRMPAEFWREVVDRVAAEVPDTLLLAEAFWLMEGYFVRTLGMHRVYNSAFMHMLRDETNSEYRQVMKNTLEFDPEVLKRYVNFMNNPDEDTAVEQFGKDDKYFGICTLLATLPGLPMFGHGQIEGYSEKYGMEYQRAYYDERPDAQLVERHRREIFPLLHRRALFAEVESFLLYDLVGDGGTVHEDVFAYSNQREGNAALVVYHNRFRDVAGWIRGSVSYSVPGEDGRQLVRRTLAEGLGLTGKESDFVLFRDHRTGLEYLRRLGELRDRGLYLELQAYEYHVFLDFREVQDDETRRWSRLHDYLAGRGVPSLHEAERVRLLEAIREPFRRLVEAKAVRELAAATTLEDEPQKQWREARFARLLEAVQSTAGIEGLPSASELGELTEAVLSDARADELSITTDEAWGATAGWLAALALDRDCTRARSHLEEWQLNRVLRESFEELGLGEESRERTLDLVRVLLSRTRWSDSAPPSAHALLSDLLTDPAARRWLRVHRHRDVLWFHQESFAELRGWLRLLARLAADGEPSAGISTLLDELEEAERASGYQVERLLEATLSAPKRGGQEGESQ